MGALLLSSEGLWFLVTLTCSNTTANAGESLMKFGKSRTDLSGGGKANPTEKGRLFSLLGVLSRV